MDIKYAAGFFDGEGHIALHISDRQHTNGKTYKRYQVECCVTQLEPDVLQMFVDEFGGYLYERKARATKSGEMHQRWDWKLTQQKCAAFLERIAPHLIVKQEEAHIALEFARTFSEKTTARTAAVDMNTLLLRRELAEQIKAVRAKKRAVSYGEEGVSVNE